MQIDWNIKVSDILTSLTILVSVVTLTITWTKDQTTREQHQADIVRLAAASIITKLDRWQALQLSLYQELQPEFIITSEKLSEDFNIIKFRDYLWKAIDNKRTAISSKVLEEQISTSYISLLAYFPETRGQFMTLFEALNKAEEEISSSFLVQTQKDIMAFENREKNYTSAMLGNALRKTATEHKRKFINESSKIIESQKVFLFDVISRNNKQILYSTRS